MAVEIQEVIVRARVRDGEEERAPEASGGVPRGRERERLVEECVEQVMQILEDKRSR